MRERLLAIDILRELKRTYTYKELSRIFGLQESLLCRYVNGTTVPSEQQARELLSWTTNRDFLQKFFKDKIKIYPDSFIDTSELLHYPSLLRLAMEPILSKFGRSGQSVQHSHKRGSLRHYGINDPGQASPRCQET